MRISDRLDVGSARTVTGRVAAGRRAPDGSVEEVLVVVDESGQHVRVTDPELGRALLNDLGRTVRLRGAVTAAVGESVVMDVDEYQVIGGAGSTPVYHSRPSYYY